MKVAIIPARIGSKRIPKKNIKNFCGKPIIFWAIKAIKKTKIFDKIIVSTDSKKIASMVKKYNVEVPFLRPVLLSDDHMLFPKNFHKRSQDLKRVYHDTGQFCWGKKNSWLRSEPVLSKNSSIVYIPKWRAHDINTMEDWNVAEKFAKLNNLLKL